MKKIYLTAILLLLLAALSINVFAASLNMTVSADKTKINRGDSVLVTVSVDEFKNCKSGSLKIKFDENMFTRSDNEWNLKGTAIDVADGDAVFAFSDAKTISGEIFSFKLKATSDASFTSSSVSVTLTLKDASGTSTTVTKKVSITVSCTHSYDSGKVTTQPTCAKEGTKTYTCTICGKTKTESIAKVAHTYDNACDTACNACGATRTVTHTWDSGKVTTDPTCTEDGIRTFSCTICGATKQESVAAVGHDYGSYKTTKDPTCTEEGEKTATCKTCGGTKTKSIESNGHSYDDGEVTKEATCTEKGKTTYTCTVCDYKKTKSIAKIDHQYDNDCDTDCNSCGAEREIQHDLAWTGDENSHWEQCTVCGYALPATEHTCEETMTYDQTVHGYLCTVCGLYPQGQEHQFDHDCDTTCDACGYQRGITHNYSTRWSMNEDGHWYECSVCGDQLEMELHVPGDPATETTDQICMICGYVLEYAANHTHFMAGDWLCNDLGHWFQCGCGEFVEPTAHNWNEGIIDEEDLVIVYTCTDCGFLRSEEYIPPTQPEPTLPEETLPQETQPGEDPVEPEQPKGDALLEFGFVLGKYRVEVRIELWMILAGCLAASVILNIVLIIALSAKKKPGKFDNKKSSEAGMNDPEAGSEPDSNE